MMSNNDIYDQTDTLNFVSGVTGVCLIVQKNNIYIYLFCEKLNKAKLINLAIH